MRLLKAVFRAIFDFVASFGMVMAFTVGLASFLERNGILAEGGALVSYGWPVLLVLIAAVIWARRRVAWFTREPYDTLIMVAIAAWVFGNIAIDVALEEEQTQQMAEIRRAHV